MISKKIYRVFEIIYKGFNKLFIVPGLKEGFGACGKNVRIAYDCDIKPLSNVCVGDNSQIGPHTIIWTTRAKVIIGNNVLMGPRVTIITGDHRTDVIGKQIIDIKDDEKLPENDADVIIQDGAWIAANVTILKGVTIGEGGVIASGATVTKDTEPFAIYGGTPARKIRDRFTVKDLEMHKKKIAEMHYDERFIK